MDSVIDGSIICRHEMSTYSNLATTCQLLRPLFRQSRRFLAVVPTGLLAVCVWARVGVLSVNSSPSPRHDPLSKRLREAELAFRTSGVISEIHCAINLPAGLCVQLPTPCLGDKWSGWVLNRPRSLAVPLCLPLIGHGSNVDHVEDCSLYEASGSGWTEKKSAKETDDMPGVLVRAERTVCRSGPLSADQLPWLYIICLFLL
ncbi:hypothetical protein Bbelb_026770 [Branchiostoma belcheri]|nr:hypothetical protein Bbelb_026770 [Branchiostoma belcheri]